MPYAFAWGFFLFLLCIIYIKKNLIMDCKMVSKTPEITRRAGRPTGSTKKKYLTPQRMQDVEDTLTLLTGKAYEDSPTVPKGWDVEKWAESACYRATQVVWGILNEKDSDSLTAAQIIFRLAKKLESKNASRQAVEDTINALAAIKHVIVDAKHTVVDAKAD